MKSHRSQLRASFTDIADITGAVVRELTAGSGDEEVNGTVEEVEVDVRCHNIVRGAVASDEDEAADAAVAILAAWCRAARWLFLSVSAGPR